MVLDISTGSERAAKDDLAWRVDSVCREHPTQLWFAAGPRDIATAKALCGGCAVQSRCLEFALSRPELLGIWAATTPSERASLRRAARTGSTVDSTPRTEGEPPTAADPSAGVRPAAEADGRVPGEAGPPAPIKVGGDVDLEAEVDIGEAHADEPDADELLTPAEAARRLGVTPNTVTRWSRAGKISAIQTIGGHRRYRNSEIEKVLRRFGSLA